MARHGSFADQLDAFKAFATRSDHTPEPITTNWSVVPANDNNPEDVEGLKTERLWEISPSVEEIMRQVRRGDVERNAAGQIVRIGNLRFSDGTQTEQAHKVTIDGKVVRYQARMPAGAMLGTSDKERAQRGGDEDQQHVADSNTYFAEMFGTRKIRYIAASKRRVKRQQISHAEAKAMLADAYANTDMSKVARTLCPDGLPSAGQKVAESFLGMRKTTCAGGGSSAWQDIVTERAAVEEWRSAVKNMAEDSFDILTRATKAKSLGEIGKARGFKGQYAIEAGKRLLVAANDNFEKAMDLARYAKEA